MATDRRFLSAALLPAALLCLSVMPGNASARDRLLVNADAEAEVFADEAEAAPAPREDQRRRANEHDWFRAPLRDGGYDDGVEDFPSAEVHDAVVANARAAGARAQFRRAESALSGTVRSAQKSFEASPELREALAAEQRAYDEYEVARREALRDVVGNAKYQAMQGLRQNLTEQIIERRESADEAYERPSRTQLVAAGLIPDKSHRDSLVAMAQLKMKVGSDARALEREALLGNERVRKAQQGHAAAAAKVAALRADFDRRLREDGTVKKARESLEDARIARVVAETYLKGASIAAGRALDFAYATHRYDYYRYNHHYDRSPYASFYGYGYRPGYGYISRRYRSIP